MHRAAAWQIEDYQLHKQLYKGKASLLYKATCKTSGERVALKLYRKSRLSALNWYQVDTSAETNELCQSHALQATM